MAFPSAAVGVHKGIAFVVVLTILGWMGSLFNLQQAEDRGLVARSTKQNERLGSVKNKTLYGQDATTVSDTSASGPDDYRPLPMLRPMRTTNSSNDATLPDLTLDETKEELKWDWRDHYQTEAEMLQRNDRFPSVNKRVQLYMADWYWPPCGDRVNARIRYGMSSSSLLWIDELEGGQNGVEKSRRFIVNSKFNGTKIDGAFDTVHFLDRPSMEQSCTHRYCLDMIENLFPALDAWNTTVPILFQFGDGERTIAPLATPSQGAIRRSPRIPVFKKFRRAMARRTVYANNCTQSSQYDQPIVFKLKTQRHFGHVTKVDGLDVLWEDKIDRAIFRGALTGGRSSQRMRNGTHQSGSSFTDQCSEIPRCKFVYQVIQKNITGVDAKLVQKEVSLLPDAAVTSMDGSNTSLYGEAMSIEEILKCKIVIMLEGNDVSSGLKWALYSNSVVLMPEPKFTSWALEELLVPWVHYVPLTLETEHSSSDGETLLDVEQKVNWVLHNNERARKIAYNGKLWMTDLLFHKDAKQDEHDIISDLVRRYARYWVRADNSQLNLG